jgi:hypothetical protein
MPRSRFQFLLILPLSLISRTASAHFYLTGAETVLWLLISYSPFLIVIIACAGVMIFVSKRQKSRKKLEQRN